MVASEKEIDKQAEANEDLRYCIVCNITKTHIDELRKLVGQKLRTAGRYIFRHAIFAGMPACDVLSIRQDVMDRQRRLPEPMMRFADAPQSCRAYLLGREQPCENV